MLQACKSHYISRKPAVRVECARTITKRKTGGGGGGGGNDDEQKRAQMRAAQLASINRAFRAESNIRGSEIMLAMLKRWGAIYKVRLVIDTDDTQFIQLRFLSSIYNPKIATKTDSQEFALLTDILNTYGLGAEFLDFIKFDGSLDDPTYESFEISLNIPIAGERIIEWDI